MLNFPGGEDENYGQLEESDSGQAEISVWAGTAVDRLTESNR